MVKQVASPLPGVFYRSSSPENPPYKKQGDNVKQGDVIGLIEVMKTFHEVKANVSGVIARFLVDNESSVVAGQPLVEIDK